jgi:hypothetical protein
MILLCSFTLILLASSWMAYSYLHQLSDCQTLYPFIHLYKTFKGQTDYSSSFTLLAKRTLTVVGWFFPQVLLLAAVGAYHRLKDFAVNRKAEPIDFLILYIAVVYATYSISAPPWGFPRYQYPLMGALCILAVASLKRLNSELLPTARLIAISAVVLAYYLMLGDPFLVYYTMKETLLENPGDTLGVYAKMLIQPLLFILPSILLFALFKIGRRMDAIKAITLSLIIPAIMAGIAVDLVQAKADYNTTYLYGETGEAGVVAYLHTIAPSSRVLCQSKEIAFYLRGMDVSVNLDEKMLESRAKTVTLIGRENPDYIVIRAIRSAEDYSTTNDPEVKELLDSRYSKHLFGSFIVYERRTI